MVNLKKKKKNQQQTAFPVSDWRWFRWTPPTSQVRFGTGVSNKLQDIEASSVGGDIEASSVGGFFFVYLHMRQQNIQRRKVKTSEAVFKKSFEMFGNVWTLI